MKDIDCREDVVLLVNEFYELVGKDELIGPVFDKIIKGDWQPHLDKMYNFWETIALNVNKYNGSPFREHIKLDIDKQHFDRWLELFHTTLDKFFNGNTANDIKKRSTQMGIMFQYKLKHIKGTN